MIEIALGIVKCERLGAADKSTMHLLFREVFGLSSETRLFLGEEGDDKFGFGGSYDFGEVGLGLQFDFFEAAEFEQEVAGGFFPDTRNVGKLGAEGAFAALVFMEGDGEAVDLVLDLFEEMKKWVGRFESYNLGRKSIE